MLVDSVYKKHYNYYLKKFLKIYNFNKDTEIYYNNFYYVDSDEEYYDEKCMDLFLETIRKIWWICLLKK